MVALESVQPNREAVLAKAFLKAAEQLGLNQTELGKVLGLERSAISRIKKSQSLAPESKQGELALMLIRIARALYALTGGDEQWIQHFMHTPNNVTGGVPAQQITSIQGITQVLQFVDAIRGKV